jgi:hypothetical protein
MCIHSVMLGGDTYLHVGLISPYSNIRENGLWRVEVTDGGGRRQNTYARFESEAMPTASEVCDWLKEQLPQIGEKLPQIKRYLPVDLTPRWREQIDVMVDCSKACTEERVLVGLGHAWYWDRGEVMPDGSCRIRVFAQMATTHYHDARNSSVPIDPATATQASLKEIYPQFVELHQLERLLRSQGVKICSTIVRRAAQATPA